MTRKCSTLGCNNTATWTMNYTMGGTTHTLIDNVCVPCLESYERRPAIRIVSTSTIPKSNA
jgi:hypothetical protein